MTTLGKSNTRGPGSSRFFRFAAWFAISLTTLTQSAGALEAPEETPFLGFSKATNDHVVVGNHEVHKPGEDSYTWEFWTRLDGRGTGWNLAIEFTGEDRYYVGYEAGIGWNFVVHSDGVRTDTRWDISLLETTGRWQFVQAVLDRANQRQILRIYDPLSDGWREAWITPGEGATAPDGTLYIPSPPSLWGFDGELQQIRFWRKARSAVDAEADMYFSLQGNEEGLAAYWPMGEGQGDTVFDLSDGQHHGTLMGSPRWDGYWKSMFEPLQARLDLEFGYGEQRDNGERLLRNFPEKFTLAEEALRFAPTRPDTPSAAALAVIENYLGRQNFAMETEIVLNRFGRPGATRIGVAALGGPHSLRNPFDAVRDRGFYGLSWVPANDEETSLLEIRRGFGGTLIASTEWHGNSPVGDASIPAGYGEGVVFFEGFEDVAAAEAGWTRGGTELWAFGAPDGGPGHARNGHNVAGTGLGIDERYPANTDAWLRSPSIDLTGAEGFIGLSFWEYMDVDVEMDEQGYFHFTTIRVLNAATLEPIVDLAMVADQTVGWRARRLQLPEEVLGQAVVLEFRLQSDAFGANAFDGWYIDDVAVAGLAPIRSRVEVTGEYRPSGALDLTLTMTTEDGHSQTLVGTDPDPLTAGNLFGFGGRLEGSGWEFDFLNFSVELGVRSLPLTVAPANFAFGSDAHRTGGESFLFNAPADWTVTGDSLRIGRAGEGDYNSVAATQVGNFTVGESFSIRSQLTLADFGSPDPGQRAGLILFGDANPDAFNPENEATFYSFQLNPHSDTGARIALREGMDGPVIAELSLEDPGNAVTLPSAGAAMGYTFEFHGSYNSAGDLEFSAILADGDGGRATLAGVMEDPPSGNHFGFGVRHSGTDSPVWDVHSYDWMNFQPLEMPFDLRFGNGPGRDSDASFFKAGARPEDWSLEENALRLSRPFRSGAGFEGSGAITSVLNHSFGRDFAVRSTLVPTLPTEPPLFLRLNSPSDNIAIGNHEPLKPRGDSYSWEFWARIPASATSWNIPFEFTGGDRYFVGYDAPNGWNFVVTSNGSRTDTNSDRWGPRITNRWVFVQAVLDRENSRQTLRIYDLAEETWHESQTIPAPGFTNPTGTLNFSPPHSGFWYRGDLQEMRFWRQARTRANAEADMHRTLVGNEPHLEGYWPMNDGEGFTIHDKTVNGNHGTLPANATHEWMGPPALGAPTDISLENLGGFARFAAPGDHLSVAESDTLKPLADSYSWEFWARLDNSATGWNLPIEYVAGSRYYVGFNAAAGWNFVVTSDGVRTDTNAHRYVGHITGRWVFVQAVLDRSGGQQTLRVYDPLEDVWHQAQVTPAPGVSNPTGRLSIPTHILQDQFQGDLQEMRFWRSARSQAEAENDMFTSLTGDEANLEAYWRMSEGSSIVVDYTANNNHATVHGNPEWLPYDPVEDLFGFGVTAMGQGVHHGSLSSVLDSALSLQWLPTVNKEGGVLILGSPAAEPDGAMVTLARLNLGSAPSAPRFEIGGRYTLELGGFYREQGGLSLVGRLTDDFGGEAEIAHYIHQPSAIDSGDWFGVAGRLPEGATQYDWERFQVGSPADLDLEPPPLDVSTYAGWVIDTFPPEDRDNPLIAEREANPSGDGIVNYLKYALGLDPMIPATGVDLPEVIFSDGVLRLTYPERHEPRDVDYLPQMSVDLKAWSGEGIFVVDRVPHPDLPGFDEVTVEAEPPAEAGRAFLQIMIRER